MGLLTTIITLLIYICILALVVYLIIWVLEVVGVALPPKVVQILWVIVALVCLLLIVQALLGGGLPRLGKISQEPDQMASQTLVEAPSVVGTPNIHRVSGQHRVIMVPEKR